jgi:hypothetical protein
MSDILVQSASLEVLVGVEPPANVRRSDPSHDANEISNDVVLQLQ